MTTTVMEPFRVERLAYDGCDPSDIWIITGIGHSKIDMEKVNIMDVPTVSEYESGCQIHENCFGHLCKTPYGMVLPMQSLVVSTPVIKNDVCKAARAAFESPSQYHVTQYRTILSNSLKKKTGLVSIGVLIKVHNCPFVCNIVRYCYYI